MTAMFKISFAEDAEWIILVFGYSALKQQRKYESFCVFVLLTICTFQYTHKLIRKYKCHPFIEKLCEFIV